MGSDSYCKLWLVVSSVVIVEVIFVRIEVVFYIW